MLKDAQYLDEPILSTAYLDDMREWVGGDVLINLLDCGPQALRSEVAALRAAWDRTDLPEVRETGHRLKGAAGSIGCRRLAAMGHMVQMLDGLDEPATLDKLEQAVEDCVAAMATYAATIKD